MIEQIAIKWFETIDSTNDEAKRKIKETANLSILAAEFQTKGRGQRGNSWESAKGKNLCFTLVLKADENKEQINGEHALRLAVKDEFLLTQSISLSIIDFLKSKNIEAHIKWPNDIYVRNKKICGILIENILSGNMLGASIVGIGLNVNQEDFGAALVNPTSMKLISGKEEDIKEVLKELSGYIALRLEDLYAGEFSKISADYLTKLFRFEQIYEYRDIESDKIFKGRILGVTNEGLLIVEDMSEASRKNYNFKQISYII